MTNASVKCRTLPCMAPKTKRVEIRTTPELYARIHSAAEERGQTLATFAERAFEAALSEAKGAASIEQAGPVPVPEKGARPAVSPRTHAKSGPGATPSTKAAGRKSAVSPDPVLAASRPTQPVSRVHSQRCTCPVCKPPKGTKQ